MPLKAHKHKSTKHHPKHYAKVYWPYLPLLLIVSAGLLLGQSYVGHSERGVLNYATNVSAPALLEATNRQRQSNSQKTLVLNSKLAQAAQAKANDMVQRNYWSHTTPEGKAPWIFVDQAGYSYQKAGENLAYGFANSRETITGWMNSPTHKQNMLDSQYAEVGFGIANSSNFQDTGPETIIVAMYGDPLGDQSTLADVEPSQKVTPSITSATPIDQEPAVKSITKAQALTGGKVPWISFAIGLLSGASIVYLFLKHGLGIRRALRDSERFVLHHPLLDLTIISFVALCALLSQSIGIIR